MGESVLLGVGVGATILGGVTSAFSYFSAANAYESADYSQLYEDAAEAARESRALERSRLETEADLAEGNIFIVKQQALAYEHEARMNEILGDANEILGEREALSYERRAKQSALILRREKNRIQGAQVVSYANSGVELEGSPALVMRETAKRVEEDIAAVLEEGEWNATSARFGAALSSLASVEAAMSSRSKASQATTAAYNEQVYASQNRLAGLTQTKMGELESRQIIYQGWATTNQNRVSAYANRMRGYGSILNTIGNIGLRAPDLKKLFT